MNFDNLTQQISAFQQRLTVLQRSEDSQLVEQGYEELFTALEELHVAEEELHQQNEELVEAQNQLFQERQRYQSLFEFAPDGYVVTDRDGLILEVNRAAAALFGLPTALALRKALAVFVAVDDRPAFRTHLAQLQQGNSPHEWEMGLHPRSGKSIEVAVKVAVAESDPPTLYWLLRDISNRKQAEQQIRSLNAELKQRVRYERTLRQIANKLCDSLDENQILQTAVQELTQALGLLGCDTAVYDVRAGISTVFCQSIASEPFQALSQPGEIPMATFATGYQQLLQKRAFQFCELTSNPLRSQVSILACPIADREEVVGDIWCFSHRDAALTPSEVELVQQVAAQCAVALRQARLYRAAEVQVNELENLHRLKNDFLSTVSHELRTPLTNMKMAIEMLKIARTPERRDLYLRILQDECQQEITLVTDLLDLQRLEAETYPGFLQEAINLTDWLPNLLAPITQQMQTRRQIFTLTLSPNLPSLITDRASLRRLLAELLHNACKYTPSEKEICLQASYQPDSDHVVFAISNQAEIAAEHLPHIFEKFYRVPQVGTWHTEGTGLGLTLVKQLVEHLKGGLTVNSSNGWTTFTVLIPQAHP